MVLHAFNQHKHTANRHKSTPATDKNAVVHAGKKPDLYEEKHLRHFPRKSKHGLFLCKNASKQAQRIPYLQAGRSRVLSSLSSKPSTQTWPTEQHVRR